MKWSRMSGPRRAGVAAALLAAASVAWPASVTRTTAYEYDADGLLIKELVEPDNPVLCLVTVYGRDVVGNKSSTTKRNCNGSAGSNPGINSEAAAPPAGDLARFASRVRRDDFGSDGRFAGSTTLVLSATEAQVENRSHYTRNGQLTRFSDTNGQVTTWRYDELGRKVLERRPDGTGTKWEYAYCSGFHDGTASCPTMAGLQGTARAMTLMRSTPVAAPVDLVAGTTGAANGPSITVYYDELGREIRTKKQGFDGSGTSTSVVKDTEYDKSGRVRRVSHPYYEGDTRTWAVRYEYDQFGRITSTTTLDNGGKQLVTTVDYQGLVTITTDPGNRTRTEERNVAGQLWKVTDASAQTLTLEYDAQGNVASADDGQGHVTEAVFDTLGRRRTLRDPDKGNWTFQYNALGELVRQTDAKGQAITTAYDTLGRMTQRSEADLVSTWYYDQDSSGAACGRSIGKLCEATTDAGYRRVHLYDSLGRVQRTSTTLDTTYVSSTSYDANGRVASQTYPSGFKLAYVYTPLGFLEELRRDSASGALYWRANALDAAGHVKTQSHGNGVVTQRTYSPYSGRLTDISAGTDGSVQDLTYAHDARGNVSWRQDRTQDLLEGFTYDALNRLTAATISGTTAGQVTTQYGYDALGNLVCKSDLSACAADQPNVTYGAKVTVGGVTRTLAHAVKSVDGSVHGTTDPSFTYDANGSMLSGAARTLAYNAAGMTRLVTASGRNGVAYLYGPERQRVRENLLSTSGAVLSSSYYLHPDTANSLHYEVSKGASGTLHKHYVGVPGQAAVALVTYDGDSWDVSYLHRDALDSLVAVTGPGRVVLERLSYDPWGKRRPLNGARDTQDKLAGATTDRGFTNHEHIDSLALVNMNGRIYDPALGRFLTADPLIQSMQNLQSYNRYAYALNNPMGLVDPTGYFSLRKFLRAVAAIAVVVFAPEISAAVGWTGGVDAGVAVITADSGAAAVGITSGQVASGMLGGALSGAISTGTFKGAFIGGFTGGLGGMVSAAGAAGVPGVALHAAAGCFGGALGDEGCQAGAAKGAAGDIWTQYGPSKEQIFAALR